MSQVEMIIKLGNVQCVRSSTSRHLLELRRTISIGNSVINTLSPVYEILSQRWKHVWYPSSQSECVYVYCICMYVSLIKLMSEELYLLAYNALLAACFTLVSCGAYSSTLKMETTGSSMRTSNSTSFMTSTRRQSTCRAEEGN
jgi:hypothetical protein